MSHIKDDTDTSVARDSLLLLKNSVFDWGFNPSSKNDNNDGNSRAGSGTEASEDGPSSRYDPKAMSRIVDITDIVDESSSDADSDDDLAAGHSSPTLAGGVERGNGASTHSNKKKGRPQYRPVGRQVLILVSIVGIIIGASLAIGYAVVRGNPSSNNLNDRGSANSVRGGTDEQQLLLEMAERITIACSENNLDEDMSECQQLCHVNMCCFESDEYSCEDDESKACAVYAGCQALVQTEEEEQ